MSEDSSNESKFPVVKKDLKDAWDRMDADGFDRDTRLVFAVLWSMVDASEVGARLVAPTWARDETLARMAAVSVKTVRRCVRNLADADYFWTVKPHREGKLGGRIDLPPRPLYRDGFLPQGKIIGGHLCHRGEPVYLYVRTARDLSAARWAQTMRHHGDVIGGAGLAHAQQMDVVTFDSNVSRAVTAVVQETAAAVMGGGSVSPMDVARSALLRLQRETESKVLRAELRHTNLSAVVKAARDEAAKVQQAAMVKTAAKAALADLAKRRAGKG